MTTVPEWLDAHLDQVLTDQRARIASAQLVATFAVAIAAAFLASAMHKDPDATLLWATTVFAVSFLAGAGTFLLDRSSVPDVDPVMTNASIASSDRLAYLRVAADTSVRLNNTFVAQIRWSRNLCLALAVVSIALSLFAKTH